MAPIQPVPDVVDQDEEYNSSEDEDFNPEAVEAQKDEEEVISPSEDEAISLSEDEAPQPKKAQKKRKKAQANAEELDSGDEATIKESRKSKRRKAGQEQEQEQEQEEESGGEGGLIKTRAQRRAEKEERQEYQKANGENVTVDVDVLWAALSSKPLGRIIPSPQKLPTQTTQDITTETAQTNNETTTQATGEDGMIIINRSYDFAGQKITEEKRVHKDSAEAKLFLASKNATKQQKPDTQAPAEGVPALRRPLRRASKYEPNPTGEVKGLPADKQRLRTPSRADVLAQKKRFEEETKGKVTKLNTVQKSAIDWAAHVDEEGYKEELDDYGRSKQGYVGKMDFLNNVHGRGEEEGRKARLGMAAS